MGKVINVTTREQFAKLPADAQAGIMRNAFKGDDKGNTPKGKTANATRKTEAAPKKSVKK